MSKKKKQKLIKEPETYLELIRHYQKYENKWLTYLLTDLELNDLQREAITRVLRLKLIGAK